MPGHFDTPCDTCIEVMGLSDAQVAKWVGTPMKRREAARRFLVRRAG